MKPSTQTEDAYLSGILHLAKLLGWRTAHFRPAQTNSGWKTAVAGDGKGFPDIVLVRGDRCIFVETKSPTGRLTAEQEQWLAALDQTPTEVYVWRAGVDTFEDIQRILR